MKVSGLKQKKKKKKKKREDNNEPVPGISRPFDPKAKQFDQENRRWRIHQQNTS